MWTILVVFAVAGFGIGFINPILGAIPFELVPQRLLGRVLSLGQAVGWAGIPLGGLAAGAAVTAVGLAPALLTAGAAYLLVTTISGLRPEWRTMDRLRGRRPGP
jgi:MFS family permease